MFLYFFCIPILSLTQYNIPKQKTTTISTDLNMTDYLNLEGKKAVVTGGRRGLGKAMAIELAKHGASVAIVSRSAEADDLIQEIKADGNEAYYFQADLGKRESRNGLIDKTVTQLGGIDILINNAGYLHCDTILDYPLEQWDRQMSVLLDAVFELSQQAARIMQKNNGGKIIQIGSTAAIKEGCSLIAYASAKSALIGMTRALASGLAQYNINVNSIAPGIFNTDINSYLFDDPEALKKRCEPVPSGRLGELDDIIGPMLFFASDMSKHVHGQTLIVDGGFTL